MVKVNIALGNASLTVFPNPIKGNLIKVQLNNMAKGRYSAVLYNTLCQRLYSSIIEHAGRSGTYNTWIFYTTPRPEGRGNFDDTRSKHFWLRGIKTILAAQILIERNAAEE